MEEYLKFLDSFHRQNCPDDHYSAWKIFVLRTNEYNIDYMCNAFRYSYTKWLEEKENEV